MRRGIPINPVMWFENENSIIPTNQTYGCTRARSPSSSSRPDRRGTSQYAAPMKVSATALPTVRWKWP